MIANAGSPEPALERPARRRRRVLLLGLAVAVLLVLAAGTALVVLRYLPALDDARALRTDLEAMVDRVRTPAWRSTTDDRRARRPTWPRQPGASHASRSCLRATRSSASRGCSRPRRRTSVARTTSSRRQGISSTPRATAWPSAAGSSRSGMGRRPSRVTPPSSPRLVELMATSRAARRRRLDVRRQRPPEARHGPGRPGRPDRERPRRDDDARREVRSASRRVRDSQRPPAVDPGLGRTTALPGPDPGSGRAEAHGRVHRELRDHRLRSGDGSRRSASRTSCRSTSRGTTPASSHRGSWWTTFSARSSRGSSPTPTGRRTFRRARRMPSGSTRTSPVTTGSTASWGSRRTRSTRSWR